MISAVAVLRETISAFGATTEKENRDLQEDIPDDLPPGVRRCWPHLPGINKNVLDNARGIYTPANAIVRVQAGFWRKMIPILFIALRFRTTDVAWPRRSRNTYLNVCTMQKIRWKPLDEVSDLGLYICKECPSTSMVEGF